MESHHDQGESPPVGVDSWVLQVRQRLNQPPPRPPSSSNGHSGAERMAMMVSLFVDSGELWTLLVEDRELEELGMCAVNFPGQIAQAEEDPWKAVARCAEQDLGLESEHVLRLGALDALMLGPEDQLIPAVAAIPSPGKKGAIDIDQRDELVALPLSAFANPRLVEERTIDFGGELRRLPVYHVGRHKIWGPVAEILTNLLQRLGFQ